MAPPTQALATEETLAQDPVPSESTAEGTASQHPGPLSVSSEGGAVAQDPVPSGDSSGDSEGKSTKESLALADELYEQGSKAIDDGDFVDAVDCLSRALEIRVSHYGELAKECASSYYKYGCALLYKAQDEADPLGNFPEVPPTNVDKSITSNCIEESRSSEASAHDPNDASLVKDEALEGEGSNKDATKDEVDEHVDEEDADESDLDLAWKMLDIARAIVERHPGDTMEKVNILAALAEVSMERREGSNKDATKDEVDEHVDEEDADESDLDLAWKMLDIARAIVERHPGDTMEKVNILAALAEVSMERNDIETSLNDYLKALSILEHLVEPDHRRIVELNFRISLVLELGLRIDEAIPYCEMAISLCKSLLQRLKADTTNLTTPTVASGSCNSGLEKKRSLPTEEDRSTSNATEEIELVCGILAELDKKLEDLQQIMSNPRSIISEVMKLIATKQTSKENNTPNVSRTLSLDSLQMGTANGGFDSPTISTAATNGGVMDLGVVGRGIKRATTKPSSAEPPHKKPTLDKHTEEVDKSNNAAAQEAVTLVSTSQNA